MIYRASVLSYLLCLRHPQAKHQPSLHIRRFVLDFSVNSARKKNIIPLLDAFKTATFTGPVELLVQGATTKPEDGELFDAIADEYKDVPGLSFLHANLIGSDWDKALLDVDAILMPYGAERYRYHWRYALHGYRVL